MRFAGLLGQQQLGSGIDPWALLEPPAGDVYLRRESSTILQMMSPMGGGWYWRTWLITNATDPGSLSHSVMERSDAVIPFKLIDHTDAGITYTGAGWTNISGQHRTSTIGEYLEWTTPADTEHIAATHSVQSNGGLALVEINGDTSLANELPTAQEFVDAGDYPNTILVANGGNLNPTDRCFDSDTGNTLQKTTGVIAVATGLTPGTHTLRMTMQYNGTGADRLYITKLGSWDSTITPATSGVDISGTGYTSGPWMVRLQTVAAHSAWESAYRVLPDAGGTATWLGSIHGYETEGTMTIEVDDVVDTLTNGEVVSGAKIEIIRTGAEYRHPDVGAGATNVADLDLTYEIGVGGLRIHYTIGWNLAATIDTGYPAMLPFESALLKSGGVGTPGTVYDLTNDDDSYQGQVSGADTIWVWDPDGAPSFALGLKLADYATATNSGALSAPDHAFIEDRITTTMDKMYHTRIALAAADESVTASSTFTGDATYRARRLADPNGSFT